MPPAGTDHGVAVHRGGDAEGAGLGDRLAQQVDQRVADARVLDASGSEKQLQDASQGRLVSRMRSDWSVRMPVGGAGGAVTTLGRPTASPAPAAPREQAEHAALGARRARRDQPGPAFARGALTVPLRRPPLPARRGRLEPAACQPPSLLGLRPRRRVGGSATRPGKLMERRDTELGEAAIPLGQSVSSPSAR